MKVVNRNLEETTISPTTLENICHEIELNHGHLLVLEGMNDYKQMMCFSAFRRENVPDYACEAGYLLLDTKKIPVIFSNKISDGAAELSKQARETLDRYLEEHG